MIIVTMTTIIYNNVALLITVAGKYRNNIRSSELFLWYLLITRLRTKCRWIN